MAIERREQVFVSSTYLDLQEERQEVIQTLLEADCIPAGMELFPASDDDRWSLIRRIIDDCDYYVVVVGGRYGSVDPDRGLSYTQMEYEYAIEIGVPVLGFLHKNPKGIEVGKSDLEPELRDKLLEFRSAVEQRMVKYWTTPQELAGQVAKSLIQVRKTHPAEGWVRARNALTPEVSGEISDLRATVAELRAELEHERVVVADDLEDLEQGADLYGFECIMRYWTKTRVDAGQTLQSQRTRTHPTMNVSWDDIFAFVGPSLMDECSERDFDSRLDALAFDLFVRYGTLPNDFGRHSELLSESENLNDIKIQLFALGLAVQSERRRAVADKNAYWTLTQRGRDHLMRLRARRRPGTDAPAAGPSPLAPDVQADRASEKASVKKAPVKKAAAKKAAAKKAAAKKAAAKKA